MKAEFHTGDALAVLPWLPQNHFHCCVTSPPYWGLRDYGVAGQLGLEKTVDEYIAAVVAIFQAVKDRLRDDGTLWLNLGDSYAGGGNGGGGSFANDGIRAPKPGTDKNVPARLGSRGIGGGIKTKDLIGIPWRVAFALQADGWYLRSDIIWAKSNSMPESVTDRPTRAHEYIFLLSKSKHYFYDADAIKEPCSEATIARVSQDVENQKGSARANGGAKTNGTMKAVVAKQRGHGRRHQGFNERWDAMERAEQCAGMRNKRDVWTVAPANYREAHFATFPPKLIEPCILAGCPAGGVVLDPFSGSGTTGEVALKHGRNFVGIELNPDYVRLAKKRLHSIQLGLPIS